jgi:hypothetical protein
MIIKNIPISYTCNSFEEFCLCYKLNTFCVSNGGFCTGMLWCSVALNVVVTACIIYDVCVLGGMHFEEGLSNVTLSVNETKAFWCLFRTANISETDCLCNRS